MKFFYLFFLFASSFLFCQISGKVIAIKDGDTIVVLLDGNIQKTLRLAEVDCPESGQPFGKNAKQFTSSQIFNKTISFIQTDTDRYGRTIAKIYYDEKYLSEEIIKAGFGWWYFYFSKDKNLGRLQDHAKTQKKEELWKSVMSSPDIKAFMQSADSANILKEYGISKSEKKKLLAKKNRTQHLNFENSKKANVLFEKGENFYRDILRFFDPVLSDSDKFKINAVSSAIRLLNSKAPETLNVKTVNDFLLIKDKLILHDPEKLDELLSKYNGDNFSRNLDWFIKKYNEAETKNVVCFGYFKSYADIAAAKKIMYSSVVKEISDKLQNGEPPTMKQVFYLNDYMMTLYT